MMASLFSETLQCRLVSIVSINETTIRLLLPDGSVTDMAGVIELAETISLDICRVEVFAGNQIDIVYRRVLGGWQARTPTTRANP